MRLIILDNFKIIAIKKGKNFPICCQCHDELEDGPRMFYKNRCMFQLIGEYSIPIRLKIENSFPKNLIYQKEEKKALWVYFVILCESGRFQ